jgi:hypothetical protein
MPARSYREVRRQMVRWFVPMIVLIAVAYGIGTGNALFGALVGGIVLLSFWLGLVVMRYVPPFRDEDDG